MAEQDGGVAEESQMPLFYPSFDALRLAQRMLDEIVARTTGYEGRIGAAWYWRLPGGILVTVWLDHTVTEERWDVLRAQASTPRSGVLSTADFPFAAYGTTRTSPPFIHDMQGVAEWSNRLYFQMGDLIQDMVRWLGMLHAIAISPQVNPPSAFPTLSKVERQLVHYALEELDGRFIITRLHEAFKDDISRSRLRSLAQAWEMNDLLTEHPRRVTYALEVLARDATAQG
jgi:hypothetical protein